MKQYHYMYYTGCLQISELISLLAFLKIYPFSTTNLQKYITFCPGNVKKEDLRLMQYVQNHLTEKNMKFHKQSDGMTS